jgi:uncharacterized protein with von Willebrand factor type A (vWA) domain
MFVRFFLALRAAGLKPGVGELLTLVEAVKAGHASGSIDAFHTLARACLVKNEADYDRYDRAFAAWFDGVGGVLPDFLASVPADWLRPELLREFSDAERAAIEALGGWDVLMKTLAERMAEQQGRHQGGNRWIGTAGTSPFGNAGYNPEGVRIGGQGRQGRAVKVWEQRAFRNLDDQQQLGTRDIALALRRLRRFAREGAAEELDLDGTIEGTARNAGWLDLRFRPERHNAIKVLLLLDVGGSMDEHVRLCETLFSAARSEFKHLEHFYFHNCLYERVWRDNTRRWSEWQSTWDLLHRYPADWRVVFVGDASMSPHEIVVPGGSVEHHNEEAGAVWLGRALAQWPRVAWLNPVPEAHWEWTPSIGMVRELVGGRMFPLTLDGLTRATDSLRARR